MSNTYNSLTQLLNDIHTLHAYSLSHYKSIYAAMSTASDYITFTITTLNDDEETISIPSFTNIERRIAAIENNIDGLTNIQAGNVFTEIVDTNNIVRQIFTSSYDKTIAAITDIDDVLQNTSLFVDTCDDVLDSMIVPFIKMPLALTDKIPASTKLVMSYRIIVSSTNYTIINTNVAILTIANIVNYCIANSISYDIITNTHKVIPQVHRYYGEFHVLTTSYDGASITTAKLDTVNYNDNQSASLLSKELIKNDLLTNSIGSVVYKVESVNVATNIITISTHAGTHSIIPGESQLYYMDTIMQQNINVSVSYNEYSYIFVAAVHNVHNTVADYSAVMQFDSSVATIINADGNTVNVNDYILANDGANIGKYLKAWSKEFNAPAIYAITPDAPVLADTMFRVEQINAHLIDNKRHDDIVKQMQSKNSLAADITIIDTEIAELYKRLNDLDYKDTGDHKIVNEELATKIQDRAIKNALHADIVKSLATTNLEAYAAEYIPKYNIVGFVPEQEPKISIHTAPQKILCYRIKYRYVSLTGSASQGIALTLKDAEGNDYHGTMSSWQEMLTPFRSKTLVDGVITDAVNNIESADQQNLNQIAIAISQNELVELQIQAISEIGYPNVEIASEWSNIITVEFPAEHKTTSEFKIIQDEIASSAQQLQFDQVIDNKQLTDHALDSFIDGQKAYKHTASSIASGFFTNDNRNINIFDQLHIAMDEIAALRAQINQTTTNIKVSILDESGNTYNVVNNSITNIFAGYYISELADTKVAGDIISKQYYIKLTNLGVTEAQINSMFYGDIAAELLKAATTPAHDGYDIIPIGYIVDGYNSQDLPLGSAQYYGQIIYNRLRNILNTEDLYTPVDDSANNTDITGHTDTGTANVIHRTSAGVYPAVEIVSDYDDCTLISDAHPVYVAWVTAGSPGSGATYDAMEELFTNKLAKQMNSVHASTKLPAFYDVDDRTNLKVAFAANDKYTCGVYTVGAMLTMNNINKSNAQISANRADSYVTLQSGDANSVLIPFTFQYRMSDVLGRIKGVAGNSDTNFEYSKSIGVALLLNGMSFNFDIRVNAKYKSTRLGIDNMPLSSTAVDAIVSSPNVAIH
jgi:hypothetical protein